MSFNIGENVGPYRITEQLGQGGMATVYKAYHAALDRYVAIKVLHPAFHEDASFIMRFQREARVVAKLEHPNIVPIYDYAEHEMRPYLVMKFIEGDTLKARLNQAPLTSNEINQVVDSIGAALAYAHKQGILHRDIKPSNVMIANDGVMYLADFGLARIAQAGESTMSSDSIMGTPQYISPEQAMGKKDLDEGTDIYSFGVMLYEMVVGQVPFSADTPFAVIHDHIYTPLPMPRAINPKVPENVERVLLKALAKDRADRYVSINDLMIAFKDAWMQAGIPMQGTSITMKPQNLNVANPAAETKVAKQVPAKKRFSKWMFVSIGIILLLFCVVGVFAFRNQRLLRLLNPRPIPTMQANIPPAQPNAAPETPPINPTQQLPSPNQPAGAPTPSPEIQAAMDKVQANKDDPNAHLDLALAFYDSKQERPAFEELLKAANLAKEDKSFFERAMSAFREREAWIPTAEMGLRLINIYKSTNMPPPDNVIADFHEAAYKAAGKMQMADNLFFNHIAKNDQPFSLVVQGRYALFAGNPAEAQIYLNDANKLKPDLLEALLLQSEIYLKESKNEEAKQILTILKANLAAADWIRTMADDYYRAIP